MRQITITVDRSGELMAHIGPSKENDKYCGRDSPLKNTAYSCSGFDSSILADWSKRNMGIRSNYFIQRISISQHSYCFRK